MFVPLPTSDVCNTSSGVSVKIAQTISRTWYNLDPGLRFTIPEKITLHPDGKGEITCAYTIFTRGEETTEVLSHSFNWKLARDGPLGMEGIDMEGLRGAIPKIIMSDFAWTLRPWTAGHIVPAYLHLSHVDDRNVCDNPIIFDPFVIDTSSVSPLPLELLEEIFVLASYESTAADELLSVCRRSRELVMRQRRRATFSTLVNNFIEYGMAMWINYGHFDPGESPPTFFFGLKAVLFKFPPVCGYPPAVGQELQWGHVPCWSTSESPPRIYHSCQLPLPPNRLSTFWRYDTHPEIQKEWT